MVGYSFVPGDSPPPAFRQLAWRTGFRYYRLDWDRVDEFMDSIDFSDPHQTAKAWVVVLAYLMTDYRYLYL